MRTEKSSPWRSTPVRTNCMNPWQRRCLTSRRRARLETVKLWRKGGIDTIEELNRKVERKISKAFAGDELCGRIEDELHDWLDELMRNLENELTTLCVRCGVPPERMSLTGAKVDAGLDGVKLSLLDAMGMDILSG